MNEFFLRLQCVCTPPPICGKNLIPLIIVNAPNLTERRRKKKYFFLVEGFKTVFLIQADIQSTPERKKYATLVDLAISKAVN